MTKEMHVHNRVTRAHMVAQKWLKENNQAINDENEDIIAGHILIAELTNAMLGYDWEGKKI